MITVKLEDMLEDVVNAGRHGMYTVGFGLSFLGLEYIDQCVFGGSVSPNISPETKLWSKEFALYASQWVCAFGTVIESIRFAYNTLAVPVKLCAGKYFEKKKIPKINFSE